MRATEHAPRNRLSVLERRYSLAEIVERGVGVPLQYLVLHLLHLVLWSWASGAAQAAQFVRIILCLR